MRPISAVSTSPPARGAARSGVETSGRSTCPGVATISARIYPFHAARGVRRRALTCSQDQINNAFTLSENGIYLWLCSCVFMRLMSEAPMFDRGYMKIDLRVDRGSLRRWHLDLAQRLARRSGAESGFRLETATGVGSKAAAALFQVETLLFGLGRDGPSRRIAPEALGAFAGGAAPYLILDLAQAPLGESARVWRIECDGVGLEQGLLAAALAGRTPTVRAIGPSGPLAVARPGTEQSNLVKASFEDWLERVATLIEAALDGAAVAMPPAIPGEASAGFDEAALRPGRWAARAAKSVKQRAFRAAYTSLCHAPHWRVGWRRGEGFAAEGLADGWTDLPDDGRRFYADPFPILWRGRTFLFVEEFEHRRGKGIISAVEFGPQGPLGAPRPALESDVHLSYPFI